MSDQIYQCWEMWVNAERDCEIWPLGGVIIWQSLIKSYVEEAKQIAIDKVANGRCANEDGIITVHYLRGQKRGQWFWEKSNAEEVFCSFYWCQTSVEMFSRKNSSKDEKSGKNGR